MHNTIKYNGHEILAPKFSVYPYRDNGFGDFNIRLNVNTDIPFIRYFGKATIYNIPNVMTKHILRSTEFYQDKENAVEAEWVKIPGKIRKKYPASNKEYVLNSSFHGIIPQRVKKRIDVAKEIFDKGLYLIAETKPEEWNVQTITPDPLLAGVLGAKCYLVDSFETTPMEDYVKREFSS